MGELIRDVLIWAPSARNKYHDPAEYRAVVDTGATITVIPDRIVDELGIDFVDDFAQIEGRIVPLALIRLQVTADNGRSCKPTMLIAAVSSSLAARAGKDRQGRRIDLILGHDYLQRAKAVLRYDDPHTVECVPMQRAPQRRRAAG